MGSCFTVPIMFSQQSFVEIKEHVKKSKCLNLRPLDVSDLTCAVPDLVIICPICLEIVRFPIIFTCGHLACHICFETDYSMKFNQLCYICRQPIDLLHLRTLSDEMETQPQSRIAKFYLTATIKCENVPCKFSGPIPVLSIHELFECPNRQIQCPAHNCFAIGTPDNIMEHTSHCPRHRAWCVGCGQYIEQRYHKCNHYCIRSYVPIGSRFWRPCHWRQWESSHQHGDVELPISEAYHPDADLIDRIKHQVQLKNGIKERHKYRRQVSLNESNDF